MQAACMVEMCLSRFFRAPKNKHGHVNARIDAPLRAHLPIVIALYFRGLSFRVRSASQTTKTTPGRICPAKKAGNISVTRIFGSRRVRFFYNNGNACEKNCPRKIFFRNAGALATLIPPRSTNARGRAAAEARGCRLRPRSRHASPKTPPATSDRRTCRAIRA